MKCFPLLVSGILLPVGLILGQPDSVDANQFAAKLGRALIDGESMARFRMVVRGQDGTASKTLQVASRSRRTDQETRLVYEILWPTEQKGEAFYLNATKGGRVQGATRSPDGRILQFGPDALDKGIFGTDLSYADVFENFFLWRSQRLLDREVIGRVECEVLESRPETGDRSPYSKVISWIDPKKMVPMRVEKFDRSGRTALIIETTGVTRESNGNHLPSGFVAKRTGSPTVTAIEGASLRRDVKFSNAEFSPGPG